MTLDLFRHDFVVSIKPEYATKIVVGDKKVELRRRFSDRVFTTLEAAAWLQNLFEAANVTLPAVQDVYAYEIDFSDSIFDELRSDYPGFDKWADTHPQDVRSRQIEIFQSSSGNVC